MQKWISLKRWLIRKWLEYKHADLDPDICCCGEYMDYMTPGITCPGYCRSHKQRIIDEELEKIL